MGDSRIAGSCWTHRVISTSVPFAFSCTRVDLPIMVHLKLPGGRHRTHARRDVVGPRAYFLELTTLNGKDGAPDGVSKLTGSSTRSTGISSTARVSRSSCPATPNLRKRARTNPTRCTLHKTSPTSSTLPARCVFLLSFVPRTLGHETHLSSSYSVESMSSSYVVVFPKIESFVRSY
jgi:hypothetical protein